MTLFLAFLPYLFKAAAAVPEIFDYVNKMRANFKREGQWDQRAEDAFTAELEKLKTDPPDWWKPEA